MLITPKMLKNNKCIISNTKNSIHLDTLDGHVFKVNGLGYMSYAIDNERNKTKMNTIHVAQAANYQKNDRGGWLWDRSKALTDIYNVLVIGVELDETLRINRPTQFTN